jgi:hypothetical protein
MRSSKVWLVIGVGALVAGVLLLEGGVRAGVIAAGVLVTLIAGLQMLRDQDDDYRRDRPHPPGS